ncbi:MAG: 2-succinyl-5-enolpyruvyl-6-hydroxy-3-cyclohexene-1-carboxylic-acid synthase [Alloprevotella sp.]
MPFSSSPQVNQLSALLFAQGQCDIVVCPGSRNGIIVHNLHLLAKQHPKRVRLHPVTDERSAGFVALGLALANGDAALTAVCVTSGSAVLGCLPAVAEAYFRHIPLLVISADRPLWQIGQTDGQTLSQNGAFLPYCPTQQLLCLPTGSEYDEKTRLQNNRAINEALCRLRMNEGGPAHLNVPIDEPLFRFFADELPRERTFQRVQTYSSTPFPHDLLELIRQARLPALLIGQYEKGDLKAEVEELEQKRRLLVLPEILSGQKNSFRMNAFDCVEPGETMLIPDLIIQVGGNFVHKRFKKLLRSAPCRVIRIGLEAEFTDTFEHLDTFLESPALPALEQLNRCLPGDNAAVKFAADTLNLRWKEDSARQANTSETSLEHILLSLRPALAHRRNFTLHLANSTAVRAASRVFESGDFPVFCNRGVNGIEGSLSAAVGCALKGKGLHLVVIGDLSFFYDANALWNTRLPSNLRILLYNDAGGGIFNSLPGLKDSPARNTFVAARSDGFSAEGIAQSFGVEHREVLPAECTSSLFEEWLSESPVSRLLEVKAFADD